MFQHGYAEANGLRMHYVSEGEGKTILFLHGFPEFFYAWKHQLADLSRDHRVIAADLPGYNLSDKPQAVEAYRIEQIVENVRGLLDSLAAGEQVILIGHDWGGIIAWAFAAAHPEYLAKLVILNAPHGAIFARELAHNPAQQKASSYMAAFRHPAAEATLSAFNHAALAKVTFDSAKAGAFSDEDKAAYQIAWSQPGALTGGLNYYRALGNASLSPEQAAAITVHVPTLVIWAEGDTALLTGNLDGLEQYVPDLQVRRIPGASHWVMHDEPALVNQYIREFIG